jgi:glutamine synthetase
MRMHPAPASRSIGQSMLATGSPMRHTPALDLIPLTSGMFGYSLTRPVHNLGYYHDIFDNSSAFKCDIEGWHTESGPGVYEAVL